MTAGRQHHASKSNRITVVLAREEDATHARSFTAARWLWIVVALFGGLIVGTVVYLLFVFTPVSRFVTLPNPAVENKYNRELVDLNRRVLSLMEEMVRIRSYNIRLRNALGENIPLSDTAQTVSRRVVEAPAAETSSDVPDARGVDPSFVGQSLAQQQVSAAPAGPFARPVSFPALMPVKGYVTRGYEPDKNHLGIDIAGKRGTLIQASADGTVVFSGWTPEDGNLVIISHPGGYVTFYKHNETLLRAASSMVRRGDPIATLGDSGRTSTGPHLHFEIWKDGVPIDPSTCLLNLSI